MSESPLREADSCTDNSDKDSSVCPTCGQDNFQNDVGMRSHHKQVHGQSIATGRSLENISCDECGSTYKERPDKIKTHDFHFCSVECKDSHEPMYDELPQLQETDKPSIKCEICGSVFEVIQFREDTAKYCSRECRIEATRRITGSERYNWKSNNGKQFGEGWEQLSEEVREGQNYTCHICGAHQNELNRRLDVHHIIPRSRFDDLNKANKKDNLVALCRSCHTKWEGSPVIPQSATE